jgi:hypothetical protein
MGFMGLGVEGASHAYTADPQHWGPQMPDITRLLDFF